MAILWKLVLIALLMGYLTVTAAGLALTSQPENIVTRISSAVWWHCQAEDDTHSTITYSWQRDNTLLPEHENQVVYSNGTLYIRRVTYDDVGTYTCSATAGDGQVLSSQATLEIAFIGSSFIINPTSQSKLLGDTVTLTCRINSLPVADIRWLLNDEFFNEGTVTSGLDDESILSLSPVLYSQAGHFKCLATNSVNRVFKYSLEATLVIKGQPVFLSPLQAVSLPLGYTATFICDYHGNPAPLVTWYMHKIDSAGEVTSVALQTSSKYNLQINGTLDVYNVDYMDEAFYTCTAGNSYGEISESAELTVTGRARAPAFSRIPQNVTVTAGGEAVLRCGCSGNPPPSVHWTKDNMQLAAANGSYTINDTQASHLGWYTCLCENNEGSLNQSVYLEVYTLPVFTQVPEDFVVRGGNSIYLHCIVNGNPEPSVTWTTPKYVNGITASDSLADITIPRNGSLIISSSAQTDAGVYTCMAHNIVGSVSSSVTVQIQEAPIMTMTPYSQQVLAGDSVYLHCQADGVPTPTYVWSTADGDHLLSSTRRQIFLNNTLVIHNTSLTDDGVYRCTASNIQGDSITMATITVTVAPVILQAPVNQTVQVGDDIALTCFTDGTPVPTQNWLKDGKQLELGENMILSTDRSELGIIGLQESQVGLYTCEASNIAGTVTVSAWLSLFDIPQFTVYPVDMTVNQSDTLTLLCQGHAEEMPKVTWFKVEAREAIPIESSDRVTVYGNGTLQILDVRQSDEDWYMCEIANSASNVTHSVFINIQVPPYIIHTNHPQRTSNQSEATLTCLSYGDPSPTLQWRHPDGHVITDSSAYILSDNSIRIVSANGSDSGEWTCKSCNPLGCNSTEIRLYVEGLPIIEALTATRSTDAPFTITLECVVAGEPSPTMTFTSQGQTVTSALQGHRVKDNILIVDERYLGPEYTCEAHNSQGTTRKHVSVPSTVAAPTFVVIGPSWVTLAWETPDYTGNLPLSSYIIQGTTDMPGTNVSSEWSDLDIGEFDHDLGTQRSLQRSTNVTRLLGYTEYRFRMAVVNVLGRGNYGESSPVVKTLPAAPSAPTNVVAETETHTELIQLSWQPALHLNGEPKDIVYMYKVSKVTPVGEKIVLFEGSVPHNQTLQVQIEGLRETVLYLISVWSNNTMLGLSSPPVVLHLDMTSAPAAHTGDDSIAMVTIIIIVFSCLAVIIFLIITAFVITYWRHQKKSQTLSLVDQSLSLDQFYMENPRSLYEDDSKISRRKSGLSFYSFDENHHSNRSINKAGKQSPFRNSLIQNEVLLVSKNPLYTEENNQSFVSKKNGINTFISRGGLTKNNHSAPELDLPDKTCVDSQPNIADCPYSQSVQCITPTASPEQTPDLFSSESDSRRHSEEVIDSTGEYSKADNDTSAISLPGLNLKPGLIETTSSPKPGFNPGPKPPIRVVSPSYLRGPITSTPISTYPENSQKSCLKKSITDTPSKYPRISTRDARSASPSGASYSNNITSFTPARVKSLDEIGIHTFRTSKIESSEQTTDHCAVNYNGFCDSVDNDNNIRESTAPQCTAESDTVDMPSAALLHCDKLMSRKREHIRDHFLTDEEIRLETQSAELY